MILDFNHMIIMAYRIRNKKKSDIYRLSKKKCNQSKSSLIVFNMCFASFLVNYPKNTSVGKEKVSKQYKNSKKKEHLQSMNFKVKEK